MKKILKRIALASVLSVLSLLLSYEANNIPFPAGENLNLFAWLEYGMQHWLGSHNDYDDVVFINVGFDKGVATAMNPDADEVLGTLAVTDREKLLGFLERIDSIGGYKYLFLDVEFRDRIKTPFDSALFSKIKSMDRIVIARHSDTPIADSTLLDKAAISDYYSTIISTNFTRYQFLQSSGESAALHIHNALGGDSIEKHWGGLWYTKGNEGLCYNCQFVTNFERFDSQLDNNQNNRWWNLTEDLKWEDDESLKEEFAGKYVFVGDMIGDKHDTYLGKVPGMVISYRALQCLNQNQNLVNWWLALLSFVFCGFVFYHLIWMRPLLDIINIHNKFTRIILSFFGFGFVLATISAIFYVFFGVGLNVFVPSLLFSLVHYFKKI